MAWNLDFVDTFAHYPVNSTDITGLGKWTSLAGGVSAPTITEDGLQGISPNDLRKNLLTTTPGRIVGCRIFPSNLVNGASGVLAILGDSGLIFSLNRNEFSGKLTIHLPDSSTIETAEAQGTLSGNTGYALELAGYCDGVDAHYEVRVDGVQVTDLTGSVAFASTPDLHTISPSRGSGSGICVSTYSIFWSKAYSGTGGIWAASDFLGIVRRGLLYPNADGLFEKTSPGAHWAPNSGSTYFEALDETIADSDTSYVSTTSDPDGSPANTDRASWKMSDADPDISQILAVQRSTLIRAPSGTNDVKLFTRYDTDTNPTNTFLETEFSVPSGWTIVRTIYPLDPRDSSAWSKAKLDSMELGIETQDLV